MLTSAQQTSLLDRLIEEEEQRFLDRSPRAAEYAARAEASLRSHLELADIPAPTDLDRGGRRLEGP